ncbi:MAG TPA: cytidylate kinase-like family protein [Tepidisphaeraceae bacterium]|nr:cytidylate kinase-like family protein [Tepidisphaeraceae bacterium]
MTPISITSHIKPIMGSIRTIPISGKAKTPQVPDALPFVTISREAGAGGLTLARQLVDSLNKLWPDPASQWTCWDRELIERVAADLKLSTRVIDSLEDQEYSWLGDFLESLSFSNDAHTAREAKVYHRVVETIRALAQSGRVVIVGRGGMFITHHLPGGIHARLVAPFEERVALFARQYDLPADRAAVRAAEIERNRRAFYRRYWPNESLSPENFTLTLNTAKMDSNQMVNILTTLIKDAVPSIKAKK